VRQIPPGGEGKITVTVSTNGYGGKRIRENVYVQTNDKKQARLTLTVFGLVEKFADITPPRVMLFGIEGQPLKTQVSITPGPKYPFKIVDIRARNGNSIKLNLEESENPAEPKYILNIENTRQTPGRYTDIIYLKTDSEIRPSLNVYLSVSIAKQRQSKSE
jgi:hypothetical protein